MLKRDLRDLRDFTPNQDRLLTVSTERTDMFQSRFSQGYMSNVSFASHQGTKLKWCLVQKQVQDGTVQRTWPPLTPFPQLQLRGDNPQGKENSSWSLPDVRKAPKRSEVQSQGKDEKGIYMGFVFSLWNTGCTLATARYSPHHPLQA